MSKGNMENGIEDDSKKFFELVASRGLNSAEILTSYDIAELSRISHSCCQWLIPKINAAAPKDTDKKALGLLAWQHKNIQKLDLTKTEEKVDKEGLRAMCRLNMLTALQEVEVPDLPGTGTLDVMRELKPTAQKIKVTVNKIISTNQAYMDQYVQMSSTLRDYWSQLRINAIYIRKQEDFTDLLTKIVESKRNGAPIFADLIIDIPIQTDSMSRDNSMIKYVLNFVKTNDSIGNAIVMVKTIIANRTKIFPLSAAKESWIQSVLENKKQRQRYTGTQYYDNTCQKWWHRQLARPLTLSPVLLCWQIHLNFDNFDYKEDASRLDEEIEVVHSQLRDRIDQLKIQFSGTNVSPEDMILGKILIGLIDSKLLSVLHLSINTPQVLSSLIDSEQYCVLGDLVQLQRLCISLNILDKDYKRDGILEEFVNGFAPQLNSLASFSMYGIVGGDDYVFFDVSILSQLSQLKSLEIQVENLLIDYGRMLEAAGVMNYLTRIELEVGFDFESVPDDVLPAISSNHLEEMEDDLMELLPQLRYAKVSIEESAFDDLIEYQRQSVSAQELES